MTHNLQYPTLSRRRITPTSEVSVTVHEYSSWLYRPVYWLNFAHLWRV